MAAQDLIQRLRREHDELHQLVEDLASAKSERARRQRASRVAQRVLQHSRLERKVLYPAYERACLLLSDRIIYHEADELNRLLEGEAASLAGTEAASEDSYAHENLLKMLLAQHVEGAAAHLFERARAIVGRAELLSLQQAASPGPAQRSRLADPDPPRAIVTTRRAEPARTASRADENPERLGENEGDPGPARPSRDARGT